VLHDHRAHWRRGPTAEALSPEAGAGASVAQ